MSESRSKKRKRPADVVGNAVFVMRVATGESENEGPDSEKDPIAVANGRKGGKAGGKSRMSALSAKERTALAVKAARARWAK